MLDISRLLSPEFIFSTSVRTLSSGFLVFFIVIFALFLALALFSKVMGAKKTKQHNLPAVRLWQKLTNFFFTLGLIGALLIFFRQQKVYFLSMPFLWYLLCIIGIVWVIFIIRWIKVKMRNLQNEIKEREEKAKYLP